MQTQDKKLTSLRGAKPSTRRALRHVPAGLSASVIICTKDREKDLLECIDSLNAQTLLPEELVIVDAGKENGIKGKLEEKVKTTPIKLKYIRTEPGLTRQRNIGVKNAKGDIVFFFDDDVILDKDYTANIMKIYSSHQNENLGGVGGKIVKATPPPLYWRLFNKIFLLNRHGALLPAHTFSPGKVTKARALSGCNMSYIREIFQELDFDEHIPGYGLMEDVDFSFRVSQRYQLLLTPDAKLEHKQSPVSRDKISRLVQMQSYNSFYLFMKNCRKTPPNLLLFAWSRIGMFLNSLLHYLSQGNSGWLTGFFEGSELILHDLFARKVQKVSELNPCSPNSRRQISSVSIQNKMSMPEKVSVIIPTKNRKDDLFETLNSVFNQSFLPFEIIIVDQSDAKIDCTSVQNLADTQNIKLKVIYNPQIKGLTQARNVGLDDMKGDIVLFLDDDLTLDQDYIKNVLTTFSEPDYEEVAGVGGIVESPQKNRGFGFNRCFKLGSFSDTREKIKDKPPGIYESRCLSGGSMSLRREDIKDLRFDENMTGYSHGEDIVFCYRLSQRKKLVINSRAVCLHKASPVGRHKGKRISNEILFHYYFFRKNLPFTLSNLITYLWFNLGMLIRPIIRLELKIYKDIFKGYAKIGKFIFKKKLEWV
jgi:glycosyltransferase involved in cell wall biosynthesis